MTAREALQKKIQENIKLALKDYTGLRCNVEEERKALVDKMTKLLLDEYPPPKWSVHDLKLDEHGNFSCTIKRDR